MGRGRIGEHDCWGCYGNVGGDGVQQGGLTSL